MPIPEDERTRKLTRDLRDLSPEAAAALRLAIERLASATHCIHCGAEVARFVQVGRSYRADPCGHRQGQGNAKGMNARRLRNSTTS